VNYNLGIFQIDRSQIEVSRNFLVCTILLCLDISSFKTNSVHFASRFLCFGIITIVLLHLKNPQINVFALLRFFNNLKKPQFVSLQ